MDTNLHLLGDMTVATPSSRDVGSSSNADLRHKVPAAHSTTPPFPRASSDVRQLSTFLMAKIRLALLVEARFRKPFHQRRQKKRRRLGYLDCLEVAGATRGPEKPPWEPKTPARTEAMITMAVHELFLLGCLSIYSAGGTQKTQTMAAYLYLRARSGPLSRR
jgi:hypothetical protein